MKGLPDEILENVKKLEKSVSEFREKQPLALEEHIILTEALAHALENVMTIASNTKRFVVCRFCDKEMRPFDDYNVMSLTIGLHNKRPKSPSPSIEGMRLIGSAGYGSDHDGDVVNCFICDECLVKYDLVEVKRD